MKRVLFTVLMCAGLITISKAQNNVLFTYGSHNAHLDEFTRQFYKNNPRESITRDTTKYYLNLFINFKLKVQQAKDMGLDTAADFVAEMAQYRRQLAAPYMVDTSVTETLIDEAYRNMQTEVKVSHIMVALGYDALPKDTLAAWNKAIDLKNKLKHESFDSVAKKYSEDQSALVNKGHLGYFTAFDMIYPFEKAAYSTKVGDITGPFRTQFGYHIIKVWDKRPYRGKTFASHVLLRLPQNADDNQILRTKEKMDSIAAAINTGKSTFEAMVTEYSEDFSTKSTNGEIGFIESTNRQVPEELREALFAIKNEGGISYPVKTAIGWHLLKRGKTETLKPKDTLYAEIKKKISNPRDERYGLTRLAVIERIKKENNFTEYNDAYRAFSEKIADTSIINGTWGTNGHLYQDAVLFRLRNTDYKISDFSKFIEANQQPLPNADLQNTINQFYKSYVEQTVWDFEIEHLGEKQEKYRHLVEEYHDGILLFNLSEKKVWNKGLTDTTGLKEYYEANKHRFMWGKRLEAKIYECKTEDVCKNVKKWVKKEYADTTISRMAHEIDPLSLAIKTGKFQAADHPVLGSVKWKKGKYAVEKDGKHYFVVIKEVLPEQPKTLSEIRGPITSEYQGVLEKQWIEELKRQYPVTVNQPVLDNFLNTLPR